MCVYIYTHKHTQAQIPLNFVKTNCQNPITITHTKQDICINYNKQ